MSLMKKQANWPVRTFLIFVGAVTAAFGAEGLKNGIIWYPVRSSRTGEIGHAPMLWLIVFGLVILLLGVIPWNIGENSRDKRKR